MPKFVVINLAFILATAGILSASQVSADDAEGLVTISPTLRVDVPGKRVILDAEVVFTEGPLELLLCPRRTKEHESILAAEVVPRSFQLALLSIGAVPGKPARFEPDFQPPEGQTIQIWIEYDQDGATKRVDAREWIRRIGKPDEPKRPMTERFVFAGSRFVRIAGEDRARWLGDEGDLVCVANFAGSVIDIAAKSDASNALLLFEAWTERIPAKGTKVQVIFEIGSDDKKPVQESVKPSFK